MNKKYFRISSFILQGLYTAFCVLDIICCLIYHYNYDNFLGNKCAYFVLDLTGILLFVPAMPIGIVLNILAIPSRQSDKSKRRCWLFWTIISPVIYVLFCLAAVCVFVATTGGI